jgi:hypothetical protein
MKRRMQLALVAAVLLTVLSTYGTCYIAGNCLCAVSGTCYGAKPLPDCIVPTCMIAESSASTWNVCAGPGTFLGRQQAPELGVCCPASCRAYDSCTHQYVSMNGSICCFTVRTYDGTGSGCN